MNALIIHRIDCLLLWLFFISVFLIYMIVLISRFALCCPRFFFLFKFSNITHTYIYNTYNAGIYKSPFLSNVETISNKIGWSGLWINQSYFDLSSQWFKSKVTQLLRNQLFNIGCQWLPQWKFITTTKYFLKICLYLKTFCKCCHQTSSKPQTAHSKRNKQNIPFEESICAKYNSEDIGDEFHYIFQCSFFAASRKIK